MAYQLEQLQPGSAIFPHEGVNGGQQGAICFRESRHLRLYLAFASHCSARALGVLLLSILLIAGQSTRQSLQVRFAYQHS